MAEVTAARVKELRDKTGAGMMDCKKALGEADGDIEAIGFRAGPAGAAGLEDPLQIEPRFSQMSAQALLILLDEGQQLAGGTAGHGGKHRADDPGRNGMAFHLPCLLAR